MLDKIYVESINKYIEIIYEDNHLLVCVKPENILSQKDSSNDIDMLTVLKAYLVKKYQKKGDAYLGLVHRLDRRVSGVMVFCKTSKSASRISLDIRDHKFHKVYIALANGKLTKSGKLVNKLVKENVKSIEREDGIESILEYKVLKHIKLDSNDFTYCKVNLKTGKYNQIRNQFALINHPLLNDFKYGYRGKNYNDTLGLRCVELGFFHPTTKEYLLFKKYDSIAYDNNLIFNTKDLEE